MALSSTWGRPEAPSWAASSSVWVASPPWGWVCHSSRCWQRSLRGGQLDYENAFPAEEGTDVDSESSIDLGWNADIGDRELANDGAGGRGEEPGLGERQGEGGAGDDAGAVRFAAFGIKPGGKIDRQYG